MKKGIGLTVLVVLGLLCMTACGGSPAPSESVSASSSTVETEAPPSEEVSATEVPSEGLAGGSGVADMTALEDAPYLSDADWTAIPPSEYLPKPPGDTVTPLYSGTDWYSFEIAPVTDEQNLAYRQLCVQNGFDKIREDNPNRFIAFDSEGREVCTLSPGEDDHAMRIVFYPPFEGTEIAWPSSGPGSLLPAPPSLLADNLNDTAEAFTVRVGSISDDDFHAYYEECKANGFDTDYRADELTFYGANADGYELYLIFEPFAETLEIHVEAPDEAA